MSLLKNSLKYISVGLTTFFVVSGYFAYPDFIITQLSHKEIQYASIGAMIAMTLTMIVSIRKTIKHAKKR
ncbi:MAG: hypothetical protein CR971_01270 [candidate division SR1 bacterium]|nr:MAG: hypothetical protein CR971_01270 [candidate division SR1 bacterium]